MKREYQELVIDAVNKAFPDMRPGTSPSLSTLAGYAKDAASAFATSWDDALLAGGERALKKIGSIDKFYTARKIEIALSTGGSGGKNKAANEHFGAVLRANGFSTKDFKIKVPGL